MPDYYAKLADRSKVAENSPHLPDSMAKIYAECASELLAAAAAATATSKDEKRVKTPLAKAEAAVDEQPAASAPRANEETNVKQEIEDDADAPTSTTREEATPQLAAESSREPVDEAHKARDDTKTTETVKMEVDAPDKSDEGEAGAEASAEEKNEDSTSQKSPRSPPTIVADAGKKTPPVEATAATEDVAAKSSAPTPINEVQPPSPQPQQQSEATAAAGNDDEEEEERLEAGASETRGVDRFELYWRCLGDASTSHTYTIPLLGKLSDDYELPLAPQRTAFAAQHARHLEQNYAVSLIFENVELTGNLLDELRALINHPRDLEIIDDDDNDDGDRHSSHVASPASPMAVDTIADSPTAARKSETETAGDSMSPEMRRHAARFVGSDDLRKLRAHETPPGGDEVSELSEF